MPPSQMNELSGEHFWQFLHLRIQSLQLLCYEAQKVYNVIIIIHVYLKLLTAYQALNTCYFHISFKTVYILQVFNVLDEYIHRVDWPFIDLRLEALVIDLECFLVLLKHFLCLLTSLSVQLLIDVTEPGRIQLFH